MISPISQRTGQMVKGWSLVYTEPTSKLMVMSHPVVPVILDTLID